MATMSRLAELLADWHNVPKGTRLYVVRTFVHYGLDPVYEIEREDGEPLPSPSGPAWRTVIGPDFIRYL